MYVIVIDETDPSKRERQLVKVTEDDQTIGDFLSNLMNEKCSSIWVSKEGLPAKNDGTDITDPNTPMTVIVDLFKCNYLHVMKDTDTQKSTPCPEKTNAFQIMMTARRRYDKFPEERKPVNAKDRLYNDVLKLMFGKKYGFTPVQVETVGKRVVSTLTDTLWYIDPFHDKLLSRGIHIPKIFSDLKGYYNWRSQKKKTPVITSVCLKEHIDIMSDVLMYPWFLNSQMPELRKSWTEIFDKVLHILRGPETKNSFTS
ncbi:Hypothetical predicted protein [Mytilus galloprovincialis]|uniref:Uncharacterized protein n=1 Tax=Mytilus galloprovincialis TaxID=29158 RepID=A0A8B6DP49_MYTGA|nr:Hypothetical predicted protein [Mytilus galloprovincialis]